MLLLLFSSREGNLVSRNDLFVCKFSLAFTCLTLAAMEDGIQHLLEEQLAEASRLFLADIIRLSYDLDEPPAHIPLLHALVLDYIQEVKPNCIHSALWKEVAELYLFIDVDLEDVTEDALLSATEEEQNECLETLQRLLALSSDVCVGTNDLTVAFLADDEIHDPHTSNETNAGSNNNEISKAANMYFNLAARLFFAKDMPDNDCERDCVPDRVFRFIQRADPAHRATQFIKGHFLLYFSIPDDDSATVNGRIALVIMQNSNYCLFFVALSYVPPIASLESYYHNLEEKREELLSRIAGLYLSSAHQEHVNAQKMCADWYDSGKGFERSEEEVCSFFIVCE